MVSRGQFDELIRQEMRGVKSQHGDDQQQQARDRVATRLNVRSGKNPNPRTSTAYKPTEDRPRKSKSGGGGGKRKSGGGGGGSKGVPIPTPRPQGTNPWDDMNKYSPDAAPEATQDPQSLWPLLLSLAAQRFAAGFGPRSDLNGPRAPNRVPDMANSGPLQAADEAVRLERDPTGGDPAIRDLLTQQAAPGQLEGPPPQTLLGPAGASPEMMSDDMIGDIRQRMYPGVPAGVTPRHVDLAPRIRTPGFYKR